eukprot:104548-Chlamydomonas_euryale.AAC.1
MLHATPCTPAQTQGMKAWRCGGGVGVWRRAACNVLNSCPDTRRKDVEALSFFASPPFPSPSFPLPAP